MPEIHLQEQPGTQTLSLAELAAILDVALAGVDADMGIQHDGPNRVAIAVVEIAHGALSDIGATRQPVTDRRTSTT